MNTKNLKINDPICSSIPIRENNEPLVEVLDLKRLFLSSQTKIISENIDGDSSTPLVRLTVKKLLKKALGELPPEYGIVFIEGYRQYEYQKKLFQDYVKKIIKEKRLLQERAEIVASQSVSNPDIVSPNPK
ncbi:hypothetical protein KJ953_01110 [Patescibacteria group bacterium]|nr:hypothetical protein [Patescibacteria group bacterium]